MSWTYPRNMTRLVVFNGIFDDFSDTTRSAALWYKHYDGSIIELSFPASGGGEGGNSMKLNAVSRAATIEEGLATVGHHGLNSPYYDIPILSSLKWKLKAKFRMYITAWPNINDSNCPMFCLDGGVKHQGWGLGDKITLNRICVLFNHGSGNVKLVHHDNNATGQYEYTTALTSVSLASGLAWYDWKITWEYDYYTDPLNINVKVWRGQTKYIDYDVPLNLWRFKGTSANDEQHTGPHSFMGRCGPSMISYFPPSGTAGVTTVEFKDILISLDDVKTIDWNIQNGIIQRGREISFKGRFITDYKGHLSEGVRIQMFLRELTSDAWVGHFGGEIVESNQRNNSRIIVMSADSRANSFLIEKLDETTSYSAKTTGEIVADVISEQPKKILFNTTVYFDATTTTYNRTYKQAWKYDVLQEMGSLESFLLFNDVYDFIHFQSPRTNVKDIHLIWGESRITDAKIKRLQINKPNILRVIGTGVIAERKFLERQFLASANIITNIPRLDLTTQAEVDAALEYYLNSLRKPIRVLSLELRNNFNIQQGDLIRATIDAYDIYNVRFIVTDYILKQTGLMKLNLLEAAPFVSTIISNLGKKTASQESHDVQLDLIEYDAPNFYGYFNVEGEARCAVFAEYEIEYSAAVVRSGKMVITDDFLDELLELWNNENPDDPTHIAIGTGTTSEKFDDSALETESSRASATATKINQIFDSTFQDFYRSVKFERIVASPTLITELGLFNAASSGTMACRVAFPVYTQSGSVTFRIIITTNPIPGPTYISVFGINLMNKWLYDGTWTNSLYVVHCFQPQFSMPTPYLTDQTHFDYGTNKWYSFVPDVVTEGTKTNTKIPQLDKIKFEFEYPQHEGADAGGGSANWTECFMALLHTWNTDEYELPIISYHRSHRILSGGCPDCYNLRECHWVLYLKFERGDIRE